MAKNALYEVSELSSNEKIGWVTDTLLSLHNLGRPETDEAVQDRIDRYFQACRDGSLRPGIESLCSALNISRTSLWNWCQGVGCSSERAEMARQAKQMVHSVLEQMALCGQINPPSWIFLAKNWMGYKDAVELENAPQSTVERTSEAIMASYNQNFIEMEDNANENI